MRKVILCLLLFTALCQFNLKGQTLRPDGWYADYIQYLHNRGYLWDLSPLEQPYSAQEVKRETANVKREETDTGYRMADTGCQVPGEIEYVVRADAAGRRGCIGMAAIGE